MKLWEEFEIQCTDYLNNRFGSYAKFSHQAGNVGKNKINSVIDYMISQDYIITDSYTNGDKLFIHSSQNLHNNRFILRGTEYMFSLKGSKYELRRLSNTYNANVIFSIKQKRNCGMKEEDFIIFLK